MEAIHRPLRGARDDKTGREPEHMENPIRSMKTIYPRQSHLSPFDSAQDRGQANGPDSSRLQIENVAKIPIRFHEKHSTLSRLTEKRDPERYRVATELKTHDPIGNGGYKERNATEKRSDDTSTQRSGE